MAAYRLNEYFKKSLPFCLIFIIVLMTSMALQANASTPVLTLNTSYIGGIILKPSLYLDVTANPLMAGRDRPSTITVVVKTPRGSG